VGLLPLWRLGSPAAVVLCCLWWALQACSYAYCTCGHACGLLPWLLLCSSAATLSALQLLRHALTQGTHPATLPAPMPQFAPQDRGGCHTTQLAEKAIKLLHWGYYHE